MGENYQVVRVAEKSFFQSHSRLMSIIGAIIVFATFAVKDAIHEQLKELVDRIDAAQFDYALEKSTDNVLLSVSAVSRRVEDIESPGIANHGTSASNSDPARKELLVVTGNDTDTEMALARDLQLAMKMPDSKKFVEVDRQIAAEYQKHKDMVVVSGMQSS